MGKNCATKSGNAGAMSVVAARPNRKPVICCNASMHDVFAGTVLMRHCHDALDAFFCDAVLHATRIATTRMNIVCALIEKRKHYSE